jgi:pteridine reductase
MSVDTKTPRVAVVTGGAVRVGAAIVRALAEDGWLVWIHHHRSPADALARELQSAVLGCVSADLAIADLRRRLADVVLDPGGPAAGRVDLLVNNAASFERGAFVSRTDADLERVLATNLVAPLSLARMFAPALSQSGGSIVDIVDVAGIHPLLGYLDHCVAKAGLEAATRALAVELAPVRVNSVAPGTVAWPTDGRHDEGSPAQQAVLRQIPLGRIGTPQDVAGAVRYLANAPFVTGSCLVVDGGRIAAAGGSRP